MKTAMPGEHCRRAGLRVLGLLGLILATGTIAFAAPNSESSFHRPALTGSIRFAHPDVRSGRTVRGELVFENRTSKPRVLLHGCKVDGLYGLGLRSSDGYIQSPAFSLVGCREQPMLARPGRTVYRFKVAATYLECSQSARDQPPRTSKYWIPLCLRDARGQRDVMPPLPPGRYTAVFFPNGTWHGPVVKSAPLVVTH